MAIKEELLELADESRYFEMSPAELDRVWLASNGFVDSSRFVCTEIEWYALLEQHFFLSLLTCRDAIAKLMLKRLLEKFGVDSRRIYMLRTTFVLATMDAAAMESHISNITSQEFDALKLGMVPYQKDTKLYLQKLTEYLDENPIDAETWSELAEVYYKLNQFEDAVQCLLQVLVIEPYAFYIFCRIGELKRLQAAVVGAESAEFNDIILESQKYFARAVELNPSYLRGWCGLFVVSKLIDSKQSKQVLEKSEKRVNELIRDGVGSAADLDAAKKVAINF